MPALPVVFTRRATRRVERAGVWWSANRPAAPTALRDDLLGVVALIAEQPLCGTPVPSERHAGLLAPGRRTRDHGVAFGR